jgi:N-hydroxyarylamine O-acetyltransferase
LDDSPWLVDVGFGSVTLTAPLRLSPGIAQQTPLGAFRLAEASDGAFDLEFQASDAWAKVYRFTLRRAEWIDYEVANWFTASHPDSFTANNLIVCRALPQGLVTLFNDTLTERTVDGHGTVRKIASAGALADELTARFGIDIAGFDIGAVFERVSSRIEA